MTIETATPSSAETIAAMFDTLVEAVAARVLARLEQVVTQLDERVDSKIEDFCSEQLNSKIDEWSANFLQDRFDEHVTISADDFDLDDTVLEIVQRLSFDVSVSR
tara:strand:- start:1029 stop:1343 length:315 start_codon:yes stop_codon:yes gene_type:complete